MAEPSLLLRNLIWGNEVTQIYIGVLKRSEVSGSGDQYMTANVSYHVLSVITFLCSDVCLAMVTLSAICLCVSLFYDLVDSKTVVA